MKTLRFILIQLLVLTSLFVIGAFGNTVTLDTTFNGTGYSLQSAVPAPQHSFGRSMVLQPDGKILMAGYTVDDFSPDKFALMRLNSDGTLDTSFGSNGVVVSAIDLGDRHAKIRLQPDGKILFAGISSNNETFTNYTLIRYNADGSFDTTFNSTGYVVQSFNNSSFDEVTDLNIQADGKIVLVGRTAQVPGVPNFEFNIGVMRFNTNGSLDTTFNKTGMTIIGTENATEEAYSVTIQADGKILIGGLHKVNTLDFLLMRLNSNGTVDTSFGNNGMTITPVSSGQDLIGTLDFQSDGKIIAGGRSHIARYTPDGILDTSFGSNGVTPGTGEMSEVKVKSDDKIMIATRFGANAGVARLMKDGAYDTKFNGGARNIFIEDSSCAALSFAFQSDDKILLGGNCSPNTGTSKFAVFRLEENRTKRFLDFDGNGGTDISIYRPSNGQWWYLENLFTQKVLGQFGAATDRPVPADFTGDGRTDLAVFRPSTGQWFISRSDNGSFYSFQFGTSGDIPVAADYDGDDIADPAVFRPSTSEWYILKSTGGVTIKTFGLAEDKPVPSDYDGDFITDIAIYRPSTGVWWIQKSSDESVYAFEFGTSTDIPVPGDYTGDNQTDAAFWRASTGEWFILRSDDYSYYSIPFGLSDDLPTPGNYTGDSRFDIVVYRPSTNIWHVLPTGGSYFYKEFGSPGDIPLPNTFVP